MKTNPTFTISSQQASKRGNTHEKVVRSCYHNDSKDNIVTINKQTHTQTHQIKQYINQAQKMSIQLLSLIQKTHVSSAKIKFPKQNQHSRQIQKMLYLKFEEISINLKDLQRYVKDHMRELIKMGQNCMIQKAQNPQIHEITKTLEDNRYEFLSDKIKGLQNSLLQTKKNQNRLLQIIQKLIQKYQIPDSATFIRQNNIGLQIRQKQKSFANIAPYQPIIEQVDGEQLQDKHYQNHDTTDTASIYHKLHPVESVVHYDRPKNSIQNSKKQTQGGHFRLRQMSQDFQQTEPVFIRKLYSKQQTGSNSLHQSRKSLKSDIKSSGTTTNSLKQNIKIHKSIDQNHDKEHRMNFMIGNLKN